ncbi:MAG TPA: class I SAM-dependent methyltransferase [Vicinamibacterales bacterium]|nr:class I SAM-dependent methyltransferase [Vicinamibacterales bacterium]
MHRGANAREPVKVGVFRGYDDPHSHYSHRLTEAHRAVAHALDILPRGPVVMLDICGGAGRVLVPAVAGHPRRREVRGAIIDLDAVSIQLARDALASSHLGSIQTLVADAGASDSYRAVERASLVIVSGVLAHLSRAHTNRLLRFVRQVATPEALLLWTIGERLPAGRIRRVRHAVTAAGFRTIRASVVGRTRFGLGWRHEVGLAALSVPIEPLRTGEQVFTFRPTIWQRVPMLRVLARRIRSGLGMLSGRGPAAA